MRKHFLIFFLNRGRYSLTASTLSLFFVSLILWDFIPEQNTSSYPTSLNSHPIYWNFIVYAIKGQCLGLQGLTKDLTAFVVFSLEYSNSATPGLAIGRGNLIGEPEISSGMQFFC